MTAIGPTSESGEVSLWTLNLEASTNNGWELFRLIEPESNGAKPFLNVWTGRHDLVCTAADQDWLAHTGVAVSNATKVEMSRAKVFRTECKCAPGQLIEYHIEVVFAVVEPEWFILHVYKEKLDYGMRKRGALIVDLLNQFNIQSIDSLAKRDYLTEVFDVVGSDDIGNESFLASCDDDRHANAVFNALRTGSDQQSWEADRFVDLAKREDLLTRSGGGLVCCLMSQVVEDNFATYLLKPNGTVIEHYWKTEIVRDEDQPNRMFAAEELYRIDQVDVNVRPRGPPFAHRGAKVKVARGIARVRNL